MTPSVPTDSFSATLLVAGDAAALGTVAGLCSLREIVSEATPAQRLVIALPELAGVDERLHPAEAPRGAAARTAIRHLRDLHHAVACAVLPAPEVQTYDIEVMQRLTTVRGWWSRLAAGAAEEHRVAGAVGAAGPRLAAALLARRLRLDGHAVNIAEPVVVATDGAAPVLHVRRTWQGLLAWSAAPSARGLLILPLGVVRTRKGAVLRLHGDPLATLHRLLAVALEVDTVDYWTTHARPADAPDPLFDAGIPVRVRHVGRSCRADGARRHSACRARIDITDVHTHPCASAA